MSALAAYSLRFLRELMKTVVIRSLHYELQAKQPDKRKGGGINGVFGI